MIDINLVDLAILVPITYAIVNLIKKATKNKLGDLYILVSMLVGAGIYAIGMYASPVVQGFFVVGLVASGIFVIKKT